MPRHHKRHGLEMKRVGRLRREKAAKRRAAAAHGRPKRSRGCTGIPQIITHATAERWKREPHNCPECSGRGAYVVVDKQTKAMRKNPCPDCDGRGEVYGRNPGNAIRVEG